jgi:hypothetical protein
MNPSASIVLIRSLQIVAAPFFAITFFYGMGLLQNKSLSECWEEFTKKFPMVYLVRDLLHANQRLHLRKRKSNEKEFQADEPSLPLQMQFRNPLLFRLSV